MVHLFRAECQRPCKSKAEVQRLEGRAVYGDLGTTMTLVSRSPSAMWLCILFSNSCSLPHIFPLHAPQYQSTSGPSFSCSDLGVD